MRHSIDKFPTNSFISNKKSFLYFGGTAYLGLQENEAFKKIFIENIKEYGTNYGASRNSNVQLNIYKKAESLLALTVNSEASITLSSGYLAGQLLLQYFSSDNYKIFHTPGAHPALCSTMSTPASSFNSLTKDINKHLSLKENITPVLFLESIDFKGNNYPNYSWLQSLDLQRIILVVDDSHGIGILGGNGANVYQNISSFKPKEVIVCCSLGKGYGIQAGAIFGSTHNIHLIKNMPFFAGASPATPAALATFVKAQPIYEEQLFKLRENMVLFEKLCAFMFKFNYTTDHPAYSYVNEELTLFLEKHHIIVTHFPYPANQHPIQSRIVLSAYHSKENINKLAFYINEFYTSHS